MNGLVKFGREPLINTTYTYNFDSSLSKTHKYFRNCSGQELFALLVYFYFYILSVVRSCSKKLEELEEERKKNKEEKKKKTKSKKQISLKVPNGNEFLEPIIKVQKSSKKKGK